MGGFGQALADLGRFWIGFGWFWKVFGGLAQDLEVFGMFGVGFGMVWEVLDGRV